MTLKKFLSVFVLTFFVKFGFSQVYQSMPQYGYGPVKRFDVDSTLTIPTVCGVPTLKSNLVRKSAIAFDTCNNKFYTYNSKTLTWAEVSGGGGATDTTSLSNRINLKLNIVDTANKWVNSVTKVNDSTIRVVKGTTTNDIVINPQATRLVTLVYNKSGAIIPKGAVVYIDGKHSNNLPSIALAEANNENNSYKTFALVADTIQNMSSGYVIQAGTITGLNLPFSTYTDGDILYLSPTIAGGYTTTKPLAPNHIVKLGSVVNAHPNQGRIEVKIENGWQLDELSDVSISAVPADSTLLQFSRVDSLWHDVSPTTAIGSRYIKPSDTANMLTNYAKTSVVNLKLNTSDSSTYFTKYRSDTMRTNIYSAINGKQASGNYLTDDAVVLGQQALGSTIKGLGIGCRSIVNLTTNSSLQDGQLMLCAYYLPFSATITGVKWWQVTQGNYTADNYNGVGLYTYSGGTLTLVASSTDDGTIWKATGNTMNSKAFSSPYSASAGVYYIGALLNFSGTAPLNPAVGATANKANGNVGDFTNSAKINCTLSSQTSLTTPITISTTTATVATMGFFLY